MATGPLLLLPVDVVAQGIIEHGLELASLALCDVALASRALQSVLGRLGLQRPAARVSVDDRHDPSRENFRSTDAQFIAFHELITIGVA